MAVIAAIPVPQCCRRSAQFCVIPLRTVISTTPEYPALLPFRLPYVMRTFRCVQRGALLLFGIGVNPCVATRVIPVAVVTFG